MKEIFLIPGLGADCRVFDFLNLSAYSCHHLKWIEPLEDESIEHYASRLSAQITSDNPIIIGVSFGGMIAMEIEKQLNTEKIILISSARTMREIPWSIRFLGRLGMHKLVPESWLKRPNRLLFYFFGVSEPVEKKLLADIVRDTDLHFLNWAIHKIANWKNEIVPKNTTLVHGSKDRVFPFNGGDITIPGGGHFMIVNKANEVSDLLGKVIG